ncbi:hypothetical protein Cgig2_012008 [Carnegiea gigantea]|uniref:Uncharacterized protein n=1 Tax=Carnegiea gigantea TaxID=171969 RepID=A0A9Q1KS48_9CARY|nr:hypothetical protein Cgig2_012008 [Carnegiea gigantea]
MARVEREVRPGRGGSNRIASLNVEGDMNSDGPPSLAPSKHFDHVDETPTSQQPGWRKLLSFVGPGFLVSLAYLDPGNLETDLQAGADHRYELLWVILIGLIFALIIQSLAANLGVSTGKHLSELCKAEYPVIVKYCLWLLAEVAVIAADIPEVIGTAFALNILFHIPVWVGVLLTGLSTLLLLGLQRYGVRKLELLIAILVFVMAACFFGEMAYVKPPAKEVIKGMFIPRLKGQGATGDAIALLGALVMPHNLFLHSALVLSRKVPKSVKGINEACKFFLIESGFALFVALLINIAVVSVSGTVCSGDLTPDQVAECNDLTLNSASFLLKNVLGRKSASIIYAVALLASGQSSTITGTYAGQYIMQIIVISWILGLGIIGINIYYLVTGFVGWLIHNSLPKLANVFIGIAVFPLMGIYMLSVIYLMVRTDKVVTFIEPTKLGPHAQDHLERGASHYDEPLGVPYREDLADIPLPE